MGEGRPRLCLFLRSGGGFASSCYFILIHITKPDGDEFGLARSEVTDKASCLTHWIRAFPPLTNQSGLWERKDSDRQDRNCSQGSHSFRRNFADSEGLCDANPFGSRRISGAELCRNARRKVDHRLGQRREFGCFTTRSFKPECALNVDRRLASRVKLCVHGYD